MLTKSQYDTGAAVFLGLYFGLPAFFLLLYFISRIRVVEQGTCVVVERLGRFHRVCDGGLLFLIPFVDETRRVVWREQEVYTEKKWGSTSQKVTIRQKTTDVIDMRENVFDLPSQSVISRDNVKIEVHVMLLYQLIDARRVAYEAYDLPHAVSALVQTTLRSIIGEMSLDDCLCSREEIERSLKGKIGRIAYGWGLELKSVELLEIVPSKAVQEAMHQQLSAERVRRALIVSSDGQREKMRLEAEGDCQAAIALATGEQKVSIIKAQGLADARRLIANAEAQSLKIVSAVLTGVDAPSYQLASKYTDAITALACNAKEREVFFPLSMDVANSAKTIATGGVLERAR